MNPDSISPSVWVCIAIQVFWLVYSTIRFAKRNDEWPLVAALFFTYCGGYRYLRAAWWGMAWGSLESFGLSGVFADSASAKVALTAMVLGETLLLATYCHFQNRIVTVARERLPAVLLARLRSTLLILAPFSVIGTLVARYSGARAAATGKSAAFQISSYIGEFPLLLVAVAILTVLAWRFGALKNAIQKISACAFLMVVACLTFGPTGRFQFMGWMVAATYLISTRLFGLRRIAILGIGVASTLALFGIAGALRDHQPGKGDLASAGIDRVKSAEDANMLDGLTFLMKVYPNMLSYTLGGEHLEILLRPIPRALWPGKPVGGYMNKLGVFNADSSGTVGICPTLFGDFYQEGGWIGIILCSMIYGWAFAWVVRYSISLRMIFGTLIRACLIAASIPLFRGGDLPGIYAWLGMAFWPVILFLWWNRRFFWAGSDALPLINYKRRRSQKFTAAKKALLSRPFKRKSRWRCTELLNGIRSESRAIAREKRPCDEIEKGLSETIVSVRSGDKAATSLPSPQS